MRTSRWNTRLILAALLSLCLVASAWAEAPKNVVLLIGDGMGFEQVKAASLYATGKTGGLAFEKHYCGEMATHSLDSYRQKSHATDSAAAATAMATGHKTENRMISRLPDGTEPQTILERLAREGKWTGLVVTCPMTHATPGGFGAHAEKRTDYTDIADDYFKTSRPNILFGARYASGGGVTEEKAHGAGYDVVANRDEMDAFLKKFTDGDVPASGPHVSGQFARDGMPWEFDGPTDRPKTHSKNPGCDYTTAPHLSEMTRAALAVLERSPKGFFLMIEGSMIDWACHENCIERCVAETVEFAKAFEVVRDWAEDRNDTLVIITADHECGGLWVVKAKGKMPEVFWGRGDHTGVNVPVYAFGPGADRLEGVIDNTDLFGIMTGQAVPAAAEAVAQ